MKNENIDQQTQILDLYNRLTSDSKDNMDKIQEYIDDKENLEQSLVEERENAERALMDKKD